MQEISLFELSTVINPLVNISLWFIIYSLPITIILFFITSSLLSDLRNRIKKKDGNILYKDISDLHRNDFKYGFETAIPSTSPFDPNLGKVDIPNMVYGEDGIIIRNGFRQKIDYGGKYIDRVGSSAYIKTFNNPRYSLNQKLLIVKNSSHWGKITYANVGYIIGWFYIVSFILLVAMFTVTAGAVVFLAINTVILWCTEIKLFMNFNIIGIHRLISQQSMESLGFEKSFDAFSKDPVEARMIITPAFMDRLEQFSDTWQLKGKIRIIWEKDTFTLLLKGDIEKYGKESDGSYTLLKSMEEILNLEYYSLPPTNTNNT